MWRVTTPFEMKTALPAKVVAERLRAALVPPGTIGSRTEFPVTGREKNEVWVLFLRRSVLSRGGAGRVLQFKLVPVEEGTLLEGEFRPTRFNMGYAVFWTALLVYGIGTFVWNVVVTRVVSPSWTAWNTYQPLVIMTLFTTLVFFGLLRRGSIERRLLEFLQDLLVGPLAERRAREGGALLRPQRYRDER